MKRRGLKISAPLPFSSLDIPCGARVEWDSIAQAPRGRPLGVLFLSAAARVDVFDPCRLQAFGVESFQAPAPEWVGFVH